MARLVAIGDSLTMGFQSGGMEHGNLSYPSLIAECMGLIPGEDFRFPDFSPFGGPPLSIEYVLRRISANPPWHGRIRVKPLQLRRIMREIEEYWEQGRGNHRVSHEVYHNLAVAGFEVSDAYQLTAGMAQDYIDHRIHSRSRLASVADDFRMRLTRRTLNPSHASAHREATQISRAMEIAKQDGIENLLLFLGSNNCLGAAVGCKIIWTEEDTLGTLTGGSHNRTLWRPEHFEREYKELVRQVVAIPNVGHVFVATIPKLSLLPLLIPIERYQVGNQLRFRYWDMARPEPYADFYTYFFNDLGDFVPGGQEPYLTREEVMQIDQTIESYNDTIKEQVEEHSNWHLVDVSALGDKLSMRALIQNRDVLPEPLRDLESHYIDADERGLRGGGLVALDGIHPTTCGYSLIAREFVEAIKTAHEGRDGYIEDLDFQQIRQRDRLVSSPPAALQHARKLIELLEARLDFTSLTSFG